jgi:putative glycerol-1-phosphate prenyltransferase
MNQQSVFTALMAASLSNGSGFLLLIDPDKYEIHQLKTLVRSAHKHAVDAILIGGSLMLSNRLDEYIGLVKEETDIPVIIFPGSIMQVSGEADALLYLSLVSGRNPEFLIGNHVVAAPTLKHLGIEVISTAYMLIESGRSTSASFMTNSTPIPRHKPEVAAVHALAAEYLGMKITYLEAGSGAELSVPVETIRAVAQTVDIPIIVGGGIRTPEDARSKVEAGADFVVVGNVFEKNSDEYFLQDMVDAAHTNVGKPM